jgi:hypothetical protein
MADIIQLRGDTGINWLTVDPILAERELGIETDSGKLKIGDGILKWSVLPYRGLVGADGDFYEQRYKIAEIQPEAPTEREPADWLIDPPSRLPDQQLWVIRAKIDGASGLLESSWSTPVLWASTGFLPTWETLETETAPTLGSMDHTVYIPVSDLSIPLPVGTASNQKLTLCNISTGKTFITGSGNPLELDEGKSIIYLWYAGEWVQLGSVGGSGDGDSGALVGDFKYTLEEEEKDGWKNFIYKKMSQSTYAELWGKMGHGFAKNSADAAEAEAEGKFWLGDGQFLFARAGQSWPITDASINITTDRITLTAHGLATDGSQNGRPIKLMRVPGQSPTMPVGSDYTEYDQNYIRVIDANTIELYASEAEAIDTSGTTGRVNFSSAGTGTFKLTTNGCYQSDAFQGWQSGGITNGSERYGQVVAAGNQTANTSNSGHATPRYASDSIFPPGGAEKITAVTDGLNGTPRTTNETRPSYVSLNMQIKAIGSSVSTGEAYDLLTWSSGWVTPADWTTASEILTHGLNTDFNELSYEGWVRSDEDGEQRALFVTTQASDYGAVIRDNSSLNSVKLSFATTGPLIMRGASGVWDALSSKTNPQYKVDITKKSLFAVTKTSPLVTVTTSQTVSIETVEKTVIIPDTVATSLDITISAGAGIDETHGIWIKNKSDEIQHVLYSTQTFWVSPGQKVKFYLDGTTLVWASGGWELRYIDWSNTATVPPSSILRPTDLIGLYEVVYSNSTSFGRGIVSPLRIQDTGELAQGPTFSAATTIRPTWEPSGPYFYTQDSGYDIKELRFWHNPA